MNSSQFELMHFYLPNQQNYTTIYGSPPDITPGFAAVIHGNSSNDAFVLVPRDNEDNLTLYSNLTIDGGAESDSVTISDVRSLPINYTFANPFGPTITHISGMGGQLGITNTIEGLTLNAGGGGDTFNLNSYDSGTALAINGGAGNDTVNWTPLGNNLAEISSMASFNYNGGADSDSMYVYNGSSPSAFDHYVSPGVLSTIRHSDAKQWVMQYANLEQVTVFATQLNDAFRIFYTSPGVAHALYGQGGTNSYSFGGIFPTTLQGVNSPVQIFGSGGTDNIILQNDEDNLARTYHVSQNTVGAAPGDNLFGPGGYVGFHAVVGTLTINNGNGADTIYAQPNISAALAFHGSNPTAAPGDTLNLVFAEALNPVFTSGGTGAGGYTFSNRAPLNYTGIETGPIIDYGPALLGDYNQSTAVDAADYVVWRKMLGQYVGMYSGADGDGDGYITIGDYNVWKSKFGQMLPGPGGGSAVASSEPFAGLVEIPRDMPVVATLAESTSYTQAEIVFERYRPAWTLRKPTDAQVQRPLATGLIEGRRDGGLLARSVRGADIGIETVSYRRPYAFEPPGNDGDAESTEQVDAAFALLGAAVGSIKLSPL